MKESLQIHSRELQRSLTGDVPMEMSETPHFGPVDPSTLPARERADHYRALAVQHVRLSRAAAGEEARAAHLELAALWMRLTAQAERQLVSARPAAGELQDHRAVRPRA